MSEKMREEFQVWFDANHKTENHSFNFAMSSAMFDAWQASRAALVVELPPEREERFIDSYQEGWNDAIDSCRVRFEGVGATCK